MMKNKKNFHISDVQDYGSHITFSLSPRQPLWVRVLVWVGERTIVPLMDWADRVVAEDERRKTSLEKAKDMVKESNDDVR